MNKNIRNHHFPNETIFLLSISFVILLAATTVYSLEILTFGDSITVGLPYTVSAGGKCVGPYQYELEKLLKNDGMPSNAYNWGVSGEMTTDGVNRISSVIDSRPADFILIMEGANDVKGGVSVQTVGTNIGIMIDKSLKKGVRPIVGTITPNTRETYYDAWIRDYFNPKIVSVATGKGVTVADQYKALRSDWDNLNWDLLHPNIAGYAVIGETWYLKIAPMFKKTVNIPAIMLLLE